MNMVIVGQGAIGLLFYSFAYTALSKQKMPSSKSLSLRTSTNVKVPPKNITVTDIKGNTTRPSLHYATDEHIKKADIILLTVKSYQVNEAINGLAHLLSPNVEIILCHNGMGTYDALPDAIIKEHAIMAMLTTHASLRSAPFTIVNTGIGDISVGLLNKPTHNLASVTYLKKMLTNVSYHKDIKEKQWLKLAINCVINPLTALHDVKNGEIVNASFKQIKHQLLAEFVLVSASQGVNFDLFALEEQVNKVALATKDNSSSMRCDLLNKQRTEIDFINGYINKLGVKNKIATPTNSQVWQAITKATLAFK